MFATLQAVYISISPQYIYGSSVEPDADPDVKSIASSSQFDELKSAARILEKDLETAKAKALQVSPILPEAVGT